MLFSCAIMQYDQKAQVAQTEVIVTDNGYNSAVTS